MGGAWLMPVLRYEDGIPLLGRRVPVMRRQWAVPSVVRPEHQFGYTRPKLRLEGEGDDGTEVEPFRAQDIRLGAEIQRKLFAHYPGHLWKVEVQHRSRIAMISLPLLHEWPYVIHLKTLASDPGLRAVVRAGGQMLERHRIPRAGFTTTDFMAAMNRFQKPVFTRGEAPPE